MKKILVLIVWLMSALGVSSAGAAGLGEEAYLLSSLSVVSLRDAVEIEGVLRQERPSEKGVIGSTHAEIIGYLLSRDPRTEVENTLLFQYAVYLGDEKQAQMLIAAGVAPDMVLRDTREVRTQARRQKLAPAPAEASEAPTIFARWRGQPRRLIERAAERKHWAMVELLMRCGVLPHYHPLDNYSILSWTMIHGNQGLYRRLSQDKQAIRADPTRLPAAAGASDYLFYLSQLIEWGCLSVDAEFECGISLLEAAVLDNRVDLLEYLLQRGADATHRSPSGETAMDYAKALKRHACEEKLKVYQESRQQGRE
ncbi:MAG: hypothetical protein ACI4RT_04690 [Candidatus Spyradenecus sp.]